MWCLVFGRKKQASGKRTMSRKRKRQDGKTKKEERQQGFWEMWCWEEKKRRTVYDRIRNEKETTKTTKAMKWTKGKKGKKGRKTKGGRRKEVSVSALDLFEFWCRTKMFYHYFIFFYLRR